MRINGVVVRVIRERTGLKGVELAERAQIAHSYLSMIEHGQRDCSPPVAKRLAAGLGVALDVILLPDDEAVSA